MSVKRAIWTGVTEMQNALTKLVVTCADAMTAFMVMEWFVKVSWKVLVNRKKNKFAVESSQPFNPTVRMKNGKVPSSAKHIKL